MCFSAFSQLFDGIFRQLNIPCVDKKDANTYNIAAQCFLPDLLEQVIASSFLYQCSNSPFW
jgi:hypothetical protein